MTKTPRSDHVLAEEIARSLPSGGTRGAAADAVVLLQRARDAGGGSLRFHFLSRAQQVIARLDPARQQGLIRRLQGEVLALQGRGGDTKIAHLTPGEIVIPKRLQTPEFMRDVAELARAYGIDPASLVIGDRRNAINPHTGQPEFDDEGEDDGSYDDAASDGSDSTGDSGATDAAPDDSPPPPASQQDYGPIQPPQSSMETVTVTRQRPFSPTDINNAARVIYAEVGNQPLDVKQKVLQAMLSRVGTVDNRQNTLNDVMFALDANGNHQFQGVDHPRFTQPVDQMRGPDLDSWNDSLKVATDGINDAIQNGVNYGDRFFYDTPKPGAGLNDPHDMIFWDPGYTKKLPYPYGQ
ncbi:MAG: hypothetical protein EPO08_20425 [Rhodospirillaceae bacterium]|nr:MAG: hypothetical protein EPO08_20425 [Rhodospirillaceae bacterium]